MEGPSGWSGAGARDVEGEAEAAGLFQPGEGTAEGRSLCCLQLPIGRR